MNRIRLLAGLGVIPLALILVPLGAQAQNTTCANAVGLTPDGTPHTGSFTAASQDRWFSFAARANRSYAMMVENNSSSDVNSFVDLIEVDVDKDCAGTPADGQAPSFQEGTEPAARFADREVLVSTSTQNVFFRLLGSAGSFQVRVVETTLFSPRWSTIGGFETFWGFQNTTNANIEVTLKIIKTDGADAVPPVTFTVNANTVSFQDTRPVAQGGLNVANDLSGSVIVTYKGPPGAIQADGFITGTSAVSGGSVSINVPVKFEPARNQP